MYHAVSILTKSRIVARLEILEITEGEYAQVLSAKAELVDASVLFVREALIANRAKYSYHWQNKSGKLICRWDNAPHHPEIETFPHHKHEGGKMCPSEEVTLDAALKLIEMRLGNSRNKPSV
jgi:hypothetical protein